MALHQGGIEQIFLDSMASNSVEVERPMIPTSIELSEDQSALKDPKSHPVKVRCKSYDSFLQCRDRLVGGAQEFGCTGRNIRHGNRPRQICCRLRWYAIDYPQFALS